MELIHSYISRGRYHRSSHCSILTKALNTGNKWYLEILFMPCPFLTHGSQSGRIWSFGEFYHDIWVILIIVILNSCFSFWSPPSSNGGL